MEEVLTKIEPVVAKPRLAKATALSAQPTFGEGTFYFPNSSADSYLQSTGLIAEKLIVPKEYHKVVRMCYDFYQRGGVVTTVINRLAEFSITDIRNGQRKTTDEANDYFEAVLHRKPSYLMRFLNTAALEYFLSGLIIPRVDWEEIIGSELSPRLKAGKMYKVPVFDLYPPMLVEVEWAGWGKKTYFLKIPSSDVRLIRAGGSKIKAQQLKYEMWKNTYPMLVTSIVSGSDRIQLIDADPILRKEFTYTQYPTPFLENALEAIVFKQQLRRMDFAVASRVINAILLVREGDRDFPLTEETRENLDDLKAQILARSNNPRLLERLFVLFSNHTTQLEWITPDVSAMLNQDKYRQTNEELQEALGFTRILITGEARASEAAEVSTYAVQPQMEQLRSMLREWVVTIYEQASENNGFRNTPVPAFKPIRLQDYIKTAAVFQQAFAEGNLSRTTRAESIGTDFETEVELMNDEKDLMEGLPAFPPMPYSPLPPGMTPGGNGRPIGSQNVPINKRNTGVKPKGQKPVSRVKAASVDDIELMEDADVIDLMSKIANERGLKITLEMLNDKEE